MTDTLFLRGTQSYVSQSVHQPVAKESLSKNEHARDARLPRQRNLIARMWSELMTWGTSGYLGEES